MASRLPLSMLLSQALVAFTLEFDNEFEHRIPHHTTAGSAAPTGRLWLTSQVMWENVVRYLEPDGVTVGLLHERSRTISDTLAGLRRWGYVTVDPWSGTAGGGRASDGAVVRPTRAGRRAQEVWRPLGGEIEGRWRDRFGTERVDQLASALRTLADRSELPLPRYLPVIAPTNNGKVRPVILPADRPVPEDPDGGEPSGLSVLLARVLLAFTLDFEDESRISLPISANTLRVLDASGVRIRDLPVRTGVSKEANAMALGFLQRHECVEVVADPHATRGKVVRLTARGQRAQAKYGRILTVTEERWRARFGSEALGTLRRTLEELVGDRADGPGPLLLRGTEPYPDGWRAGVRRPETLPHYPMVLHRGGYPDGS
jgi:DNA-binding MarR family transcriptional regulator